MFVASKTHVDSAYQVLPVIKCTLKAHFFWFQGNIAGMNRKTFSYINNMLVSKQDASLILNNNLILNFDWCGCEGSN